MRLGRKEVKRRGSLLGVRWKRLRRMRMVKLTKKPLVLPRRL
jgi:hypothetical protein